MKTKPYKMSRADYKLVADAVMNFTTSALEMDRMTALPFVSSITEEIRPVIEKLVTKQASRIAESMKDETNEA